MNFQDPSIRGADPERRRELYEWAKRASPFDRLRLVGAFSFQINIRYRPEILTWEVTLHLPGSNAPINAGGQRLPEILLTCIYLWSTIPQTSREDRDR